MGLDLKHISLEQLRLLLEYTLELPLYMDEDYQRCLKECEDIEDYGKYQECMYICYEK